MIIAGVVIETLPDCAPAVGRDLQAEPRIKVEGNDGDRRLAAVWEGQDGEALEAFAERLIAGHKQVLGVFPVYVGEDEEEVG